MLQRSSEPSAIWDILEFLTTKQREIGRKYDYRYSVLTGVFARLLAEGWISEKDLVGLGADKMELIRHGAGTVRELSGRGDR
jgi:hypothetical protein